MPRGAKFGGRKPGTPNKATADVRALAQSYAPAAMQELARLATEAESEQARVAAAKELLDRAYGKASQTVEIEGKVNHVVEVPIPVDPSLWLTTFGRSSGGHKPVHK